jgi:hypothetical protein
MSMQKVLSPSYSQNNVPNGLDRFQTSAFAGLHLLIGSKLRFTKLQKLGLSPQTVCNLTFCFAKNR